MAMSSPPLKSAVPILADWVELSALANEEGVYVLHQLMRFRDTHREKEDADSEGFSAREDDTDEDGVSGGDDDAFLDSINDELGERKRALGGSYPFELTATRLTLLADLTVGQKVYLFCLLLANCKEGDVLSGTWLPQIDHRVRDLFQACSTVAAAGEVHGCAISFGWPRPESNPPFLQKLHEVYGLFGEGQPVDAPKPGASPMVKDEEIDIIAWRPRIDDAPGTEYMLGQVASGHNWDGKSLKGGIDYFHRTWFVTPPVSTAVASIFIPHFPITNGASRREAIDLLHAKFGRILDRLRIPYLVTKGIDLSTADATLRIERIGDLGAIDTWVNSQVASLRDASRLVV